MFCLIFRCVSPNFAADYKYPFMQIYKIKKGLTINLKGKAQHTTTEVPLCADYAIRPDDFYGIVPKLLVKEGEQVKVGTPLFTDKSTRTINVVSPVSGVVKQIERGERRKILYIHITPDMKQERQTWDALDEKADAATLIARLCETGLFAFFKQRPYDIVADPQQKPKGIFVSAFNTMPLAADFSYVLQGEEEAFKKGMQLLQAIAPTHLGIDASQAQLSVMKELDGVIAGVNVFEGANPAGNVGVQINQVSPINKGEVVWTLQPADVIMIGRHLLTQQIDLRRTIALAGSEFKAPAYIQTLVGAPLLPLLEDRLQQNTDLRLINGNPLVGETISLSAYVGYKTTEISAILEGQQTHEAFGWIAPRLKQFSANKSYFSWLFPQREYTLDCRIKGGKRHMIMSGEYDKVFPMDILPEYLIKAIITGDIDRQEELGIYEVAPEDFAVAEFVDSSKLELQRIVREGLDILRKENA